jgi:hypothetical protein
MGGVEFAIPEGPSIELELEPRLESWNQRDDPVQVALREFVAHVRELIDPALEATAGVLAFRLDVGLADKLDPLWERDLDNYLFPIARTLQDRVVSIWGTKRRGARSFVRLEPAAPATPPGWQEFATPRSPASEQLWKSAVRRTVESAPELPQGPVGLQLTVLHIHGYWLEDESVIFGRTAYDRLLHDEIAQTFLKSRAITHSLLYVGVGEGVRDPNFESLRHWIEEQLPQSTYRDFRLVLGRDLDEARRTHSVDRIEPVAFGARHDELAIFLLKLAAGTLGEISQDPSDYTAAGSVAFPSVGVLDHAASAASSLAAALESAGRASRLLGQITNRTREPPGMVDWDEDDRIVLWQQMVVSLPRPAAQLRQESDHLHGAVRDGDAAVGLLLAALEDAEDEPRAHARRALASIAELRGLLDFAIETYATLHREFTARRAISGRWQPALDLLEDASPGLEGAQSIVESWLPGRESPDGTSHTRPAGRETTR